MCEEPIRQKRTRRLALIVTLALALPIVPAVLHGEFFAGWAESWRADPPTRTTVALAIGGALALDIVLPTPSGPLSTLAGALLGPPLATLVCWLGMTAGAAGGFALTRRWGPWMISRVADSNDLDSLRETLSRSGMWMLVATRPLPVIAEAVVVLSGVAGMSWSRFFPPVAVGNLVVAAVYATVGHASSVGDWLAVALLMSAAIPLTLLSLVRLRLAGGKPKID